MKKIDYVFNPQRIDVSRKGMISTQHEEATKIGAGILRRGGNAIDAAVGAAFALGVCEPNASGLGGQTMMLVYLAEPHKTFAVDGSSHAPNKAIAEEMVRKRVRRIGYRATTVPSTPAVLEYMLRSYGSIPLKDILQPSIDLARNGYRITKLQHDLQKRELKNWSRGNSANIFLKEGKKAYSTGSLFKQPVLADTLERLARVGIEDFYRGEIADEIVKDMEANDGFIRADDLARIPYPIERKPLSGRFNGLRIFTFPPPGAGRTLIEMFNILSKFKPKDYNTDRVKGLGLLIEVIRRSQLDRRDRPFDPNFYPQVQDRRMLSGEYAELAAKQIRSRLKRKSGGETTHLSVMDSLGNVVSLTQSIERVYGAFVATPSLGFLYNNYLNAFEYEDITNPYYLRPNSVPWASVAPTIVFKGKKPYIAIGSPGSERITSSILQVLLKIFSGYNPLDAVSAPRLHCTYSGNVSLEASRIRRDLLKFLKKRGFTIDIRRPFSFYLGCVQLVLRSGKGFVGVADLRRDGSAEGP